MSMMDLLEEKASSTPLLTMNTEALLARLGGDAKDAGATQALFARLASKLAGKDAIDTDAALPDEDAIGTEAAPLQGSGDDTDAEEARVPRPPVLKPALAWIDLFLQLAYAALLLGLFYGGGRCPAIPLSSMYLIGTSACVVGMGAVRFIFGHENVQARHSVAAAAMALLAVATFGFLVLGLVIVPVHFDYYRDPGPDTCDLAPLVALAIPLAIPALMCCCCLSSTCCALSLLFAAAATAAAAVAKAEADVAKAQADVRSKMKTEDRREGGG